MFKELDVVTYTTGKTYLVSRIQGSDIGVVGWKNGKPFGAFRFLPLSKCTLAGHATRPETSADSWTFTPVN